MPKRIPGLIFIASLLLSPHAFAQASVVVHGPAKYTRTAGAPNIYRDTFSAAGTSGAAYKLVVENGAAGKDKLSSAVISLNGLEIVKQNELNQTITIIEKPVSLLSENTLEVRLASGPSGSITLSIVCASGCTPGSGGGSGGGGGGTGGGGTGSSAKIVSPISGSLVNRSQVIVKGTISGMSGEIGVNIQSTNAGSILTAPAETQNGSFAGIAPLRTGDNTITVTATDASGKSVTDSIQVYTQSIEDKVKLTAFPETGTAPFAVTLNADISLPTAMNYAWDTNGDGTTDQSGAGLTSLKVTYDTPRLYFPSVTVTDGTGKTYTDTTVINVLDKTQLDLLLKAKWEGMKTKLVVSDIDGAVTTFLPSTQERYREIFTALLPRLPEIAGNMQNIQFITLQNDRAKYRIRKTETYNGQAMDITYYVYFGRDSQGRWQIEKF